MKMRCCYIFCIWILAAIISISQCSNPIPDGGHCVWYDTCDENPVKPGLYLNCEYYGPAVPLPNNEGYDSLVKNCPILASELEQDVNGEYQTCCSPESIGIMNEQMASIDELLGRCPSCVQDLKKNFCFFACHPRQSNFLMPLEIYINDTTGMRSVYSVEFYMNPEYSDSTYEACETVYYPAMNTVALDVMCGPFGAEDCSPERLFNYFGYNFLTPFNISYVFTNETVEATSVYGNTSLMTPFNEPTLPCNVNDTLLHCPCTDCMASCPAPPSAPPGKDIIYVGQVQLYVFLLIIIYIILTLSITAVLWKKRGTDYEVNLSSPKPIKILSAEMEEFTQKRFRELANACTTYPKLTIFAGIIFMSLLATGIKDLELTTDPVELWASPESRTRKEKEYFDESFGPFYRTTQIIITSKDNSTGFNYTDELYGVIYEYEFESIFEDYFLLDVLNLQLQIMSLQAFYEDDWVTLNDVCLRPMEPLNNECLIESVLNYWQNDPEYLESQTSDENPTEYIDHMMKCIRNPTYVNNIPEICLGTYGGPIFPYVALGGFLEDGQSLTDNPEYNKATALVITILLTNNNDKSKLGPVMAWEEVFLNFMKNYSHPLMDIAYYSERSIEDELIRESKGDVATLLISYLVMFIYVALTLGRITRRLFVDVKISLGLAGVVLVMLSVMSSIGFYGYMDIKATVFVIEVVPFLVLAVGVDNIFLLVQTLQREKRLEDESQEDFVSRVVGKVAPSMLIATASESLCFFLGALSDMPAVYAFSLYAGLALTIDFALQVTVFVSIMYLDYKRTTVILLY